MKSEVPVSKSLDEEAGTTSWLSVLGRALCEPAQIKGAAFVAAVLMPLQSLSHKAARKSCLKIHFSVQNLQ